MYTENTATEIATMYTTARTTRKNKDILVELEGKFNKSQASIRAKLMAMKVYVKDTDAEKPAVTVKEKRVTKTEKAIKVLKIFGLEANTALVEDLAKIKGVTLDAILDSVEV